MVRCQEPGCGNEYSELAAACPKCGRPNPIVQEQERKKAQKFAESMEEEERIEQGEESLSKHIRRLLMFNIPAIGLSLLIISLLEEKSFMGFFWFFFAFSLMCWFIYTGGRLLGSLFGGIGMLIGGVLGFCAVLGISFMMRGWPTWLSNIILWPAYLAWAGYQYVYPFVKFYRLKKQNQKVKDLNREIDDL